MPYGTAKCEAFHAEVAGYFQHVTSQTRQHATMMAKTITLRKCMEGLIRQRQHTVDHQVQHLMARTADAIKEVARSTQASSSSGGEN